jgi:mannose-1-phosphate guanylyltransferase/phosphomannomutase
VRSEVKLWPNKVVETDSVVNQSIVHGARWQRTLFASASVGGLANVDVTPEVAVRLGAAYASTLQRGDAVVVSRDRHPASVMMKRALMAGITSAGVRVFNLESAPLPVLRYAGGALGARGGVFTASTPGGQMELRFLDARGVDIDAGLERKIENLYFREDARKVSPDDVGTITYPAKVLDIYVTGYLGALGPMSGLAAPPRLVVDYQGGTAGQVLPQVLAEYGVQAMSLGLGRAHRPDDSETGLTQVVQALHADCGVALDPSGGRLTVVDDLGRTLSDQETLVLMAALASRHGRAQEIAVPITATAMVEAVCGTRTRVRRTRAGSRSLMEAAAAGGLALAGDGHGGFCFPGFHPGLDGLFAVGILLHWLALDNRPLSALCAELPEPAVSTAVVNCPWKAKGQLMRRLVEATLDEQVTLLDGIKIHRGDAWVAVLPDAERPSVRLWAEPDPGAGAELLAQYRQLVESLVAEADVAAAADIEPA